MSKDPVRSLLDLYPKIFLACHTRHVRDPKSKKVLTASQAGVLDHLDDVETIGLNDLARHMGVTPATMSITIERLVTMGFVLRSRDREDARRVHLRLSAAGVRIKEAQSVLDPELVAAMLERLSPEELEEGLKGLALLARAAQELQSARSEQGQWARKRPAASTSTPNQGEKKR